jgi:hypothetical protein
MSGIDAATTGRPIPFSVRPPRSPLRPYKRARGSPLLTTPIPSPISHSPSPSALCTGVPTAAALTTVARSPLYLPSFDEWTIGFPVFHSPSPAPWLASLHTGAARGQAPASSVPPVHRGPRSDLVHGSIDPVHDLFTTKVILLIQGNSSFAQNPLSLY